MSEELKRLKQQLLSRIDLDDLLEVKKVERYISFLQLEESIDKILAEEDVVVVTENGQQRFVKSHPLLNEKKKISAQADALEKIIKFEIDPLPTSASQSVEGQQASGESYQPGDLV